MKLLSLLSLILVLSCGDHSKKDEQKTEPGNPTNEIGVTSPQGQRRSVEWHPEGVKTDTGFRIELAWEGDPAVRSNENKAKLIFTTLTGTSPKSVVLKKLEPWMKIHGHGAGRRQPEVVQIDANSFAVKHAYFVMPGPWEMRVTAVIDGNECYVEIPIEVPNP